MPGTWKGLVNQPKFNASTMLLLTDGTVLCQESGGLAWWRLAPNASGSYLDGSWSAVAPMHHTRLYYASAVLGDGRVFVAGGEYSDAGSETNTAEIYDPATNVWTEIQPPAGWGRIGDAPCTVLPDGRVLLGQISDTRTAIYDPVSSTWSAGANKRDQSSEESWVLLPDNTIVTAQCAAHPGSEKYLISSNSWINTGNTPSDLVEASSIEIGAAVLLPDGRAFFVGATPHTALYTPGAAPASAGAWNAGPDIPNDAKGQNCGAKDAPACLMTNGNVLLTVGPVDGNSGHYLGPTYFYEYDGKALVRAPDPPNSGSVPFVGRMLLLPSGEILYASGTPAIYAYSAATPIQAAWRPEIVSVPQNLVWGTSYSLSGRQLNGLSQAVGYGDDASAATNYPLIRLSSAAGVVSYCRTFGHSTMSVATGSAVHTTNFVVPLLPPGAYSLEVVANGIASAKLAVTLQAMPRPFLWEAEWQWLIGSLADGPLWAIGAHGPVPVDPMDKVAKADARAARQSLLKAVRVLSKIGAQSEKLSLSAARKATPETDPELLEAKRGKTKKAARRKR